jgi:hypothetical protein
LVVADLDGSEMPVRFMKTGLAAGFAEDRFWKMAVGKTTLFL